MSRRGVIGRFTLTLTTALVVAAIALPATALGTSPQITFGFEYDGLHMGSSCVAGRGPSDADLHLVWKSATGVVKANVHVQTTSSGYWPYCSPTTTLTTGDVLKASVGSYTRKFAPPTLKVIVDRVAGEFRGMAPAGSSFVLWFIHRGCCADFEQHVDLTANSTGNWTYDNEGYDVNGYEAHADWVSAKGDYVSSYGFAAEARVRIDRPNVAGYANPFTAWKVALWDPALGVRKGIATGVTNEWGSFSGVFLDSDGDPVNVRLGDKVVGKTLASDMHFIVRNITATANVANDIVTGMCGNIGGGGGVDVVRNGHFKGGIAYLDFDEQGNFTVDFSDEETLGYDPANIRHGDRLLVTCGTPKGDFVVKKIVVP